MAQKGAVVRKLLAMLVVVLLVAAGCGNGEEPVPDESSQSGGFTPISAGTLTVATNLPAPGFWNGDDPSAMTGGFEFGIAKELAKRLGLDGVKVVNVSFDSLVAGQAQGFDLALSQVTITDERAEVVDFTVPYFSSDQGVLVRKGTKVADLSAAKKLRWGAQQSTTGQAFLDSTVKPDKEPSIYAETTQAFTALQANQIDAVLLDTSIVLAQAAQEGSPFEVVGQFRSGESYGGILPKSSNNLDAVNEQLEAMRADGTLDKLSSQFLEPEFGGDPAKIPVITT